MLLTALGDAPWRPEAELPYQAAVTPPPTSTGFRSSWEFRSLAEDRAKAQRAVLGFGGGIPLSTQAVDRGGRPKRREDDSLRPSGYTSSERTPASSYTKVKRSYATAETSATSSTRRSTFRQESDAYRYAAYDALTNIACSGHSRSRPAASTGPARSHPSSSSGTGRTGCFQTSSSPCSSRRLKKLTPSSGSRAGKSLRL